MRLLLIFLLASATWAQTGIMRVQRRAAGGGGGSPTFVIAVNEDTMTVSDLVFPALTTSSGDTAWVVLGYNGPCADVTPVTVSSTIGGGASGDTFSQVGSWVTQAFSCVGAFLGNNLSAGGGNYVIKAAVTTGSIYGVTLQFRGLSASALDQNCSGSATSGSPGTCSGAMTPSTTPVVIVGGITDYYAADTFAAGSGYTLPTDGTVSNVFKVAAVYQIADPASGTYNPSITITGTQYWSFIGAVLK
jgi:hypothetical protein